MRPGRVALVTAVLSITAHSLNAFALPAQSKPTRSDSAFLALLHRSYGFKPHELTSEKQSTRSENLDRFWTTVEKDTAANLPPLRRALASTTQPPFFYFDAGRLLLKTSRARADAQLVLNAFAHTDVRDLAQFDYVKTVHDLAMDNFDTSEAAFRIFIDNNFNPIEPENSWQLGYRYSLVFMLLPSNSAKIPHAVLARYPREKNDVVRMALLYMAYQYAPEGDSLVQATASSAAESAKVRDYAKSLLANVTKPAKLNITSPEIVRAARRKAAANISRAALSEIEAQTQLLRSKVVAK